MNDVVECPKCGKKAYVRSVFGSICSECLYDPKDDVE